MLLELLAQIHAKPCHTFMQSLASLRTRGLGKPKVLLEDLLKVELKHYLSHSCSPWKVELVGQHEHGPQATHLWSMHHPPQLLLGNGELLSIRGVNNEYEAMRFTEVVHPKCSDAVLAACIDQLQFLPRNMPRLPVLSPN